MSSLREEDFENGFFDAIVYEEDGGSSREPLSPQSTDEDGYEEYPQDSENDYPEYEF